MKPKILIVDDEPEVLELLEFNLSAADFSVISGSNGNEALRLARVHHPELIILDVMMPEMDGLEACKQLRRDPATAEVPILMLTARAAEIDRVLGLELGADDYVTKPFSPRELVLRIKGLLRRGKPGDREPELQHYRTGELALDVPRHLVTWAGKPIQLTATEFKLVCELIRNRGRVLTREHLLTEVWGYNDWIDTRTVDTHMRRLREKLGAAARHLDTVRGVGYRFIES